MSEIPLEIIYQDEYYVAIHKPHGLIVHRTEIAADSDLNAMLLLRDQLGGAHVYPCHRIDRKTSGVLLFARDTDSLRLMRQLFESHQIAKKYITLVRGYLPDYGMIEQPLANERGNNQEAKTEYWCYDKIELPIYVDRYPTSRYSIGIVQPHTGRTHQIRRHMAHIRHYIIGDKTHGECKQNKAFRELYQHDTMMLHAAELVFRHPVTGVVTTIRTEVSEAFGRLADRLGLRIPVI